MADKTRRRIVSALGERPRQRLRFTHIYFCNPALGVISVRAPTRLDNSLSTSNAASIAFRAFARGEAGATGAAAIGREGEDG